MLRLPLGCVVVEKCGFWTRIFKGRGYPKFCTLDMHFQIALISDNVAGFSRVPFSELSG